MENAKMEEKMVKVNCSFCGKEIDCPENMTNSEKHACFECFKDLGAKLKKDFIGGKIHVELPDDVLSPGMVVDMLVDDAFPEMWKEYKAEMKELPRRELAERMFAIGAEVMMDFMMQMSQDSEEDDADGAEEK